MIRKEIAGTYLAHGPTALFNGGQASIDWCKASITSRKVWIPIRAELETDTALRTLPVVTSLLSSTTCIGLEACICMAGMLLTVLDGG